MAVCGYRSKNTIAIIICTNVITNLVMNILLTLLYPQWTIGALVLAETLVVVAEYLTYFLPFGRGPKLFLLTLAANALSWGLGLLLMRIL